MGPPVAADRIVVSIRDGAARRRPDRLAIEEPLEVRVDGEPLSVTMRTPGHDFELALGFCLAEGVVARPDEVATIRACPDDSPGGGALNVVDVRRRHPAPLDPARRRSVTTTSACGLCGTTAIGALRRRAPDVADDPVEVAAATLATLPERLRAAQAGFDRTGGLHAAGLFTAGGKPVCVREDVGRHNAVDKVVGWAAGAGRLPLRGHVLVVSGRVAFEITQKALVAGIPVVAAISAPSSLAVDLAEASGMTVVGFLRGSSMNVYTAPHRVHTG